MAKCKGITAKGTSCKLNACEDTMYCRHHSKKTSKNPPKKAHVANTQSKRTTVKQKLVEECVVCLDEHKKSDFIIFSCKHQLCKNCINNMYSTICPCCREDFSDDIDTRTKRKIHKNRKRDIEEKLEEERQFLIEEQKNEDYGAHDVVYTGPPQFRQLAQLLVDNPYLIWSEDCLSLQISSNAPSSQRRMLRDILTLVAPFMVASRRVIVEF